jgi:hypothetical protein
MAAKTPRRKALFDESNVTPGGTCLSSFVVISSGQKVLVGKMAKPDVWVERFFVGPKFAPVYASSGKYILPARHLAWYESPLEAAQSVISEQVLLEVPKGKIKLIDVQSHVRGDLSSKDEPPHWDICFVYTAKISPAQAKKLKSVEWFQGLEFKPRSGLTVDDFTRGHGDVLEEAGVIRKTKQK